MREIEVDNLQDGYLRVVDEVLTHGREVSPRGIRTLELAPAVIQINNPALVVPVGVGRNPKFEIGAAESMQLLAGVSDAAQLVKAAKNFGMFVEHGRLRGAYGPRLHSQYVNVVKLLQKDPDTRQAGLVIWRPWDLASPSKDVPCTVEMHFALRGGKLDMLVLMRSNDIFWGLPYDAWMFSNVQHAVAHALDVEVGKYTHIANSLHAYVDRDMDKLKALHQYDGAEHPPMLATVRQTSRTATAEARFERVREWARLAVTGAPLGELTEGNLPSSVQWYRKILASIASEGLLCPECRYILPKTEEHFWLYEGRYDRRLVCKACRLLRRRGLTAEEHEYTLFMQHYACAICGDGSSELVLDHDHATGKFRGAVCRPCNQLLGVVDDRSEFLDKAREYVESRRKA